MTGNVRIEGGCVCGAVRYVANAPPLVVRACWCRMCQALASGNATINLAFERAAITVTGALRDFTSVADSGNRMHREFCPACGTQMFSSAEERPHLRVVRGGTLDDASLARPQALIWTASAPAWAVLDPSIPHFTGQPPAPQPR